MVGLGGGGEANLERGRQGLADDWVVVDEVDPFPQRLHCTDYRN